MQRILSVQYAIPDVVQISQECRDLISRIFVADPATVSNFCFLRIQVYYADIWIIPDLCNNFRDMVVKKHAF